MRAFDVVRLAFIGVVVLFATLMLIRVLPAFRFVLLIILVSLLVYIMVYLLRSAKKEKEEARAYAASLPGQIKSRIKQCEEQLERLRNEVKKIGDSMKDLERKLRKGTDVPAAMQQKTESVLQGFRQELDLRQSKISFYQQCINKLQKILRQHELLAAVEQKKEELDTLREQHYEEIADMEQLRWDVEREETYLSTIQDLSTRMQQSSGVEEVLHLQKELDKMLAS
ncbi:MAG: hypothetical protein AAFO03_04145 [Bacteroidota bacterium]